MTVLMGKAARWRLRDCNEPIDMRNQTQKNIDPDVVAGFGDEWSRFDQSALSEAELTDTFSDYFGIFPWHRLPPDAEGFDMGCGSGRWASLVAPRAGVLNCVDPSEQALGVAKRNLGERQIGRAHV